MIIDKRGQGGMPKWVVWLIIIGVVFLIVSFFVKTGAFNKISFSLDTTSKEISEIFPNLAFMSYFGYVFGEIPQFLIDKTSETSAFIVMLALWFLIFITFGDILTTFSTFSKEVSWAIGLVIAIIAANLNWIINFAVFAVGIFAFLGTLAVFVGMFAAFAAFVVVNWGIGRFGPWIIRRRTMQAAATEAIESEAGGTKLGGVLKGLQKVGEGLKGE